MTDHILAAYAEDINIRIDGSQPQNATGIQVNAHEIESGEVYRDENVTVTAFPVVHGDWQHAFGFRFDTADRSIVVTGDTVATDAVVEACSGCDVLVATETAGGHALDRGLGRRVLERARRDRVDCDAMGGLGDAVALRPIGCANDVARTTARRRGVARSSRPIDISGVSDAFSPTSSASARPLATATTVSQSSSSSSSTETASASWPFPPSTNNTSGMGTSPFLTRSLTAMPTPASSSSQPMPAMKPQITGYGINSSRRVRR